MFLLSTDIGDMCPLPVAGVALPRVVVDIAAAVVAERDIVVLLHSI